MPIGTTAALLIGGGLAASAGSSAMRSKASKSAANMQAQAAERARQIQNQRYQESRASMQPYISAGQGQVRRLSDIMSSGGQFVAPEQARQTFPVPRTPVPLSNWR